MPTTETPLYTREAAPALAMSQRCFGSEQEGDAGVGKGKSCIDVHKQVILRAAEAWRLAMNLCNYHA